MEPMNLGSPVSNMSPNQSQFLPCFLMGDGPCSTSPPRVGGIDFGAQSSPFVYPANSTAMPNTSLDFGRSPLANNSLFGGAYYQQQQQQHQQQLQLQHSNAQPLSNIENFQNNTPTTRKNAASSHHQAGPPIQGLFDSLRSNQLALNSSQSNLQNQSSKHHVNESNVSMSATQNNYDDSFRVMCSPLGANMSPIGLGVGNTPSKGLAAKEAQQRQQDLWVTIFGFPVGSFSMVLQHFQMFGTVVEKVLPPQNCNWMHIKYSGRLECDRALQFNQKIIRNNIMIGVKPCNDPIIIDKENAGNKSTVSRGVSYQKLRPLAQQGVELAENEILVNSKKVVANRSNTFVDKAMEFLFNW